MISTSPRAGTAGWRSGRRSSASRDRDGRPHPLACPLRGALAGRGCAGPPRRPQSQSRWRSRACRSSTRGTRGATCQLGAASAPNPRGPVTVVHVKDKSSATAVKKAKPARTARRVTQTRRTPSTSGTSTATNQLVSQRTASVPTHASSQATATTTASRTSASSTPAPLRAPTGSAPPSPLPPPRQIAKEATCVAARCARPRTKIGFGVCLLVVVSACCVPSGSAVAGNPQITYTIDGIQGTNGW